jgi:hypothetical protein
MVGEMVNFKKAIWTQKHQPEPFGLLMLVDLLAS